MLLNLYSIHRFTHSMLNLIFNSFKFIILFSIQLSGNQVNQANSQNQNISGNVSFSEFLHQIEELTKWLNQIQTMNIENSINSSCEKYANQV